MSATEMPPLPAGYGLRAPADDDIPAILALLDAFELAHSGQAAGFNAEDIREGWSRLELATDAWYVSAPDGEIAGYGEISDIGSGRLVADCYTHPRHLGRGIGTLLVRRSEARARELVTNTPAPVRVVIENNVEASDRAACDLLEREGYTGVRYFSQMRIDLVDPPAVPIWPDGIAVRAFVPRRDERATYEAAEEAFADHWGHAPRPFEEWIQRTERPDFDPSLWFLAEDRGERVEGGELAGVALCRLRGESGWVGTLAVRRPWRKRGLGMSLLTHTFGEFYRRGFRQIGLGVDAESLTGATRLYERAGMRVVSRAACYQKELRPGTDMLVRSLDE